MTNNWIGESEVDFNGVLLDLELRRSELIAQITEYKLKRTYDWLVSMLSKDLQCIDNAIYAMQQLYNAGFAKGYKSGCRNTEKKYNQVPHKYYDKEAYRSYSINKLKEDMPHLF